MVTYDRCVRVVISMMLYCVFMILKNVIELHLSHVTE